MNARQIASALLGETDLGGRVLDQLELVVTHSGGEFVVPVTIFVLGEPGEQQATVSGEVVVELQAQAAELSGLEPGNYTVWKSNPVQCDASMAENERDLWDYVDKSGFPDELDNGNVTIDWLVATINRNK